MFSFVETRLFTRLIRGYLTDEDYSRLQRQLIENPKSVTDSIPGHLLRRIREELADE